MELNESTFNLYAAKHYDNPFCFNEDEFQIDVKRIATIKRMISWHNGGNDINIRLLLNNVISFYNVFEHHAATTMLQYKMDRTHYLQMNAMLYFLSYPLIGDGSFDIMLHRRIVKEFRKT